jgi:hypothetical protein
MRWARRLKSLSSMAYSLARRLWDDAATPFRRQDGCHADRAAICDRGAPWPGPRHPPPIGATARRGGGRARSVAAGTRGAARCRAGAPTAEPGDAAGTTSRRSSPRSPGASASRVSRATSHGRPDATPGRRGGVVQSGAPHQGLDQHIPRAPRLAPSGAGTRSAASCTTTIARRPRSCIPRRLNSCTLRARRSASARTARAGSHPYPASRRTTDQAPAARRSTTDAGRHLLMSPG